MTAILLVMLVSVLMTWRSLCRPRQKVNDLKAALAGVRTEVLAGCVIVFTSLMPAVRFASIARIADGPLSLRMLFVLEAAVCIAMLVAKSRLQSRVQDEWRCRVWETVLHGGMV